MYKLIIVDDDSFILEQFASAFDWEAMGFTVVSTFSSSSECLAYLGHKEADALLTDIRMPVLSGLELAKICSEKYPHMGIIITSAYTNFEYAHQAIKYNVIDYVLKPIHDDDFTQAMARLKAYLDKSAVSSNAKGEAANPTIREIQRFVDTHYHENITTQDVANHIMINPDYFSLYFKKHTGENFTQYLRRYRLEKACDLLKNTDLKISVIAEQISYKSLTHFYELFFKQYGMTPAEYRKQFAAQPPQNKTNAKKEEFQ